MRKPMALSLTVGSSACALDSVAGARGLRQIDRDDLPPVAVNLVVRLHDHARDLTRDADPFVTREWLLVHVGMEEHATSELLALGRTDDPPVGPVVGILVVMAHGHDERPLIAALLDRFHLQDVGLPGEDRG